MLSHVEMKRNARNFAKNWKNRGYEKGESQVFWLSLLQEVLGVERPQDYLIFENQVKLDKTSFIDARIPSTQVLIEQKSINKDLKAAIKQSDGSYLTPIQQAKRYAAELPYSERPRWIVISNFQEIHIYDMEKPHAEAQIILLKDLENEYYRLQFLVDRKDEHIEKELEVSLKAGELVGKLYDALLKEYNNPNDDETLHNLNQLCVRLVFCFYAEDSGLFGRHNMFHDYLNNFRDNENTFRKALISLFNILNIKEEDRDPYEDQELLNFPYVNGGLFENSNLIIPRLNKEIIDIILDQASYNFDWSNISPTIFGGVFESTLNPETRRAGGMHYTSIENIHKLINPLFMNDLNEEFSEINKIGVEKRRKQKLLEFHEKISNLVFFDPAAGSGNFLTETFIQLRKLENKILEIIYGNQMFMGDVDSPVKISIDHFYGIEINDFAATVAKTALWIAEAQMFMKTKEILHFKSDFLPIKSYPNITVGNALRLDWEEIVPKDKLDYIMGNPPFVGARLMNKEQKDDISQVFGKLKGAGNLDYVACWYKKAADFIKDAIIQVAFVSTNSITQGEQVSILWEPLITDNKITINFAYRTFKWDSEASLKAQVHVVIVGFSLINKIDKHIFDGEIIQKADNINAYLVSGPNVFIKSSKKAITNVSPMLFGSMPNDGGNLILSNEEKNELIKQYPESEKYIKRFLGAREFINNLDRWCLWIESKDLKNISKIKPIRQRIENVKSIREESTRKSTRNLADYPYAFGEIRQPKTDYLLVPRVSSENRKYIPIGFINNNIVASDATLIIPEPSISLFAILSSNVHMAWMRTVSGRLKSDYRYSASIVYNNFPFIHLDENNKKKLEYTAKKILEARKLYEDWSYADLYDELLMLPELRKAHQENDKAVMEAYGFDWRTMTESDCVAELMKLYQEMVNN
ncbi:MAG: N-6 DNA methylase [Helcococcus sp.]|nr:N-6 DNA methylase [Helcococcus sp.]